MGSKGILRASEQQIGNQAQIRDVVDSVIRVIERDRSFRLPRSPDEQKDGFKSWLFAYQSSIWPALEDNWKRRFPEFTQGLTANEIRRIVASSVWPGVEEYLVRYVITSLAGIWTMRKLGDGLRPGVPRKFRKTWRVPVTHAQYGEVGEVVLDLDGNIVPSASAKREEIVDAINSRRIPSTSAGASKQ